MATWAVFAALAARESVPGAASPSAASRRERRTAILRAAILAVGGAAFVAFHFAGLFVWMGLSAAVLLVAQRAQGGRAALRRVSVLAVPALVNLPMYIGASRAPPQGAMRFALLAPQEAGSKATLALYVPPVDVPAGGWQLEAVVASYGTTRLAVEVNGKPLAGMQFAVEMQPATLRIPLGNLAPGWSTVTLGARQDVPWLLLSHACAPVP